MGLGWCKNIVLLVLLLWVGGCATAPGDILNEFYLSEDDNGQSITTGARQRVVLNHNPNLVTRPGLVTPQRIVCTEPSPDVAVAVANSYGAAISILQYGSGSLSQETVEGIAQLAERTASIQLLRERMFRACEAYSNGAITGTTYTLLMNDIGRELVTTNLGENAAGRFGRSLAALGGKATASSGASIAGFASAIEDIGEASAQLGEAEAALLEAQNNLNAELEKPEADRDQDKLDELRNEVTEAERDLKNTKELLRGEIKTATEAAGEFSTVEAAGQISATASAEVANELEEMQKSFLDQDPIASVIDACIVEMANVNVSNSTDQRVHDAVVRALVTSGEPLRPEDARGLAISTHLTRVSGLYSFCDDNLAHILGLAQRKDLALKGYALETERARVEVQHSQAQTQLLKSYTGLMTKCEALSGDERSGCVTAADALRTAESDVIDESFTEFAADVPTPSPAAILPTTAYNRASDASQQLDSARNRLSTLQITLPNNVQDPSNEQRSLLKSGHKLIQERGRTLSSGTQIATRSAALLNAKKRSEIESLESRYAQLRKNLQTVADSTSRADLRFQLRMQHSEARRSKRKYEKLASDLSLMTAETENLLTRIDGWGKAVDQAFDRTDQAS